MSYDIHLCDPVTHNTLLSDAPHPMAGGMYAIGGTRELWLNVTYNYSDWYYADGVFGPVGDKNKGIRTLYGLSGAESIPVLEHAIAALEAMPDKGQKPEKVTYWTPTRENAIHPLYQLLAMARMRPDGVWDGD